MQKWIKFALILILMAFCLGTASWSREVFTLDNGSEVIFLNFKEAEKALLEDYQYFNSLSHLDFQARMGKDYLKDLGRLNMDDFKEFVKEQADDFSATQEVRVVELLNQLLKVQDDSLPGFFPESITLIKTNGREEYQPIYPRGRYIVIGAEVLDNLEKAKPPRQAMNEKLDLAYPDWFLVKICRVIIELKYKSEPVTWEKLLNLFGFQKVFEKIDKGAVLESNRLVNPEYYGDEYMLKLGSGVKGQYAYLLPVYFARSAQESYLKTNKYKDVVAYGLADMDKDSGKYQVELYPDDMPVIGSIRAYPDYEGLNTSDLSSPIAVVGDNVGLLVMRSQLQEKDPDFEHKINGKRLDILQRFFLLGK